MSDNPKINGQPETPEGGGPGGVVGLLGGQAGGVRGDAKMVARLLSLGVVSTEQAEEIVRQGFVLLAKSAQEGSSRKFTSLMNMVISAARLAQNERHKIMDKIVPDQHEINSQQGAMIRKALQEIEGDERFEQLAEEIASGEYSSNLGGGGERGAVVSSPSLNGHKPASDGPDPSSNGRAYPTP